MHYSFLGAVSVTVFWCAGVAAQPVAAPRDDAAAFGSREAVSAPAVSADGSSVIYLTPGPGPATVAVISNLSTGQSQIVIGSSGKPEALSWCRFASPSRTVCRTTALSDQGDQIIGASRLVAVDRDGSKIKLLGQTRSAYDAYARQYDGKIIDWLGSTDGKVLMSREYVPEEGKTGTLLVRTKSGLGVDRVDTSSLRSDTVETPRVNVSDYATDGLGVVRLRELYETGANGYLTGLLRYDYRKPGSKDWI